MFQECPLPTALTPIVLSNCPFRMDQIVKLLFQRKGAPAFEDDAAMKLLATWTALLSSATDTKVVVSPTFSGLVIPQSEGTFVGGNDNSTVNGIREYYGEQMVTVTGTLKNVAAATIASLDMLTQESMANALGGTNLSAFFVNRYGMIYSAGLKGIEIYNLRFGSRGSEGFNSPDIIPFSFDLKPEWDRTLTATKPAFDALTQLVNA